MQRADGRRMIGRQVIGGAAVIAAALLAQSAGAQALTRPSFGYAVASPSITAGAAPAALSALALVTPVLAALPTAVPAALAAAPATPAGPDFRLHAMAPLPASAPIISDTGRLRSTGLGTMTNYYPFGADGFHLSGGTRFYSRGPARMNPDSPIARLLYAPRSSLIRATRRMTPALTMGYSRIVAQGLTLGIEGGAMLGKFDTLAGALVQPPRLRTAGFGRGGNDSPLNQIARLTMGYRF